MRATEFIHENKIILSTDPNWYGAEVGDYKASGPVINIPANQLVGFEPDDKMNQPASKANVAKIVAGIKQGAKLPPLLVRRYKNGYQVLDGHHRFWAYKLSGVEDIPAQVVPDSDIEEKGQQGVSEGRVINTYLWHGSRHKNEVLVPRQAVDTGGAAGSNQRAIYATNDPKVAIAMGLTTSGSDTGMFPNDPQMVLFTGKIRRGENVYLHKLPMNGPDGQPQFVQGGNPREWHSRPDVESIKPTEIKAVPVNRYLDLIRKATPQDWAMRKRYMKKQGVSEGQRTDRHEATGVVVIDGYVFRDNNPGSHGLGQYGRYTTKDPNYQPDPRERGLGWRFRRPDTLSFGTLGEIRKWLRTQPRKSAEEIERVHQKYREREAEFQDMTS